MRTVVIDGRAAQDGSATRGIGTYLRGLLGGFGQVAHEWDIEVLLEAGGAMPPVFARSGIHVHPHRLPHIQRHLRPFLDPLCVRRALGRRRPHLYHGVEFAQPLVPPMPVVVTVHDLIPFVMPKLYPWMRRERLISLLQLRHADAVIAVSHATARDLMSIAEVDPRRITVVPEGVKAPPARSTADLGRVRERLRLPQRFLLAVGTFDARKGLANLVEVVRRVRADVDVGLVIAGHQGNFAGAVEQSVESAGVAPATRILGYVSEDDLDALYRLADCLVFTSAYEGFGLPPLEALARGTPVVAFDNSSLPEVLGDTGALVTDGDTASMAATVTSLITDPTTAAMMARRGPEHAARFTWRAAAASTLDVYQRVTAGR